jgi:hypothetical protein
MDTQTINAFSQQIQKVAQALKQPAQAIYAIYVRQQIVSNIVNIIGDLLWCGIMTFVIIYLAKLILKHDFGWEDDKVWTCFIASIGVVVLGVALWFVMGDILSSVVSLINPQYAAIQDIISTVKGN